MKNDKHSTVIPIAWPGEENKRSSVRLTENLNGLKENIDDLLEYINKKTGIKITRNRFCISAFKFYFDALLKSENVNDMLKNMVDEE